jgi:hypothetical protein
VSDKIKVEVELDVQDLHRYVQTSEDDYSDHPVSITDAVIERAARYVADQFKDRVEVQVGLAVTQLRAEIVKETVQAWTCERLEQGVQRTNDWGEPTGQAIPLSELIKHEISKQLQPRTANDRYHGNKTVLSTVIETEVNRQLTTDLQAAFNTARDAMLKAAQEAGAQALRAAVTKAVGG